jgi:hypothetical protein
VKRVRYSAVLVMIVAALYSSSESLAQERGSPTSAQKNATAKRAAEIERLHAWLRGLTGTFQVTVVPSQIRPSTICVRGRSGYGPCIREIPVNPLLSVPHISGIAICSAVGQGSGVSCVFDLENSVGQFPPIPHVILYGVDPDKPGVRIQQFDADGITTTALGDVKGDSAIFSNECANREGALSCTQILRIRVPPNAKGIDMAIDQDKILISKSGRSQGTPTGQRIELKRQR